MPHLTCAVDDGLATLVLNNPQQNRTDSLTATELAETLEAIGRSSARVVLVHAEGPEFPLGGRVMRGPALTRPAESPALLLDRRTESTVGNQRE
ncbi:hypothetical protein [Streptomyces sp. R41]|uniref:Enoyl-CoA hydratase n=1 Tax=Streptomyces sp. R41 TaxID=3238632 RepID=A0AB39RWY5_9ACTN